MGIELAYTLWIDYVNLGQLYADKFALGAISLFRFAREYLP